MAEQLQKVNKEYDALAKSAEADLKRLVQSKEWEVAKAAVDAAGLVDPTPVSDAIGTVMSLSEGDFIGAGLSALSMVPYLGDAVAKTTKGARALKKLKELTEGIAKATHALAQYGDKFARRKAAAQRVRDARKTAPSACVECTARERFGVSKLPSQKKGRWSGEEGNSEFQPGTWSGEPGRSEFLHDASKPTIKYNEGYPDFTPHVISERGVPAIVDIDMKGNHLTRGDGDFAQATEQMRRKLGDSKWEPDYERYTWHHHENGSTMQLVPNKINSDFGHTGGVSVVKGPTGGEEF